jgi:hypothetical protein
VAELDELAGRLDRLAEELSDAALDALRQSLDAGEARSELERRLTRARRSVERAAAIVRGATRGTEDADLD